MANPKWDNRGARGVAGRYVLGPRNIYRLPNQDPPPVGGAWTDATQTQTFLASGIFIAPSSGISLNKRGKMEVYLTACAAGGNGGFGDPGAYLPFSALRAPNGGQGGDYCWRYKVELSPGEHVPVTIPISPGGSFVFGTYLTLSGGVNGTNAINSMGGPFGDQTSNSNLIISGDFLNENIVREGAGGAYGGFSSSYPSWDSVAVPGRSNLLLQNSVGGISSGGFGAGGAGLFGDGGNASSTDGVAGGSPAANTGAGGGAGDPGGSGASGRCYIEWRVAA
jgi:hypothetical protein